MRDADFDDNPNPKVHCKAREITIKRAEQEELM